MRQGIQKWMTEMGAGGCYTLTLIRIGEIETGLEHDPFDYWVSFIGDKLVRESDQWVMDASGVLLETTGRKWTVLKAGVGVDSSGQAYNLPMNYTIRSGEHDIERWGWDGVPESRKDGSHGHFVYRGPGGYWDSWGGAATVANGVLVSRRICRPL